MTDKSISQAVKLNLAKEFLKTLLARNDIDPTSTETTAIAIAHANGLVKNITDSKEKPN